jgi:cobalt-zinc-cadmium efflux system outer membrane protein
MPSQPFIQTLKKPVALIPLCLMVSVLLGGAKIQEKPLSPTETAVEYERRFLSDPLIEGYIKRTAGYEAVQWPLPAWDLNSLTLAAFYYHPDLDVARARWKTLAGGIDNAASRPNPVFQSQSRYSINPSGQTSPWYLQLFSGFTIETAGKRGYRIEQAGHLAEVSRLNIGQVAWQVRSRLRSNLVIHLGAIAKLATLQEQRVYQQDILQGIQNRVAVGESSPLETTQTRISLEQIQLQIQEAERQRRESLALVAQSIGIPLEAINEVPLASDWFDQPAVLADVSRLALRREALLGRADILGLMAEYQASHAALKLVISQRYPDVRIGPGYLWNQGEKFWALPVDLVYATQYSTKGAVQEALARRNEVATRFTALQAQVIGEVDRGYINYQATLDKLAAADGLLAQQALRRRIVQNQLDVGEADRLALRLVDTELQTARLNRIDALTQAQQALGLLEDAIQRPVNSVRPEPEQLQSIPRLGQTTP